MALTSSDHALNGRFQDRRQVRENWDRVCAAEEAELAEFAKVQANMRVAAGSAYNLATDHTPQLALLEKQIFENVDYLSSIRNRVSVIADKLVGSRPENTAATGPGYGGNGVLDSLRSVAVVQREALERIMEDLARMEADLGL